MKTRRRVFGEATSALSKSPKPSRHAGFDLAPVQSSRLGEIAYWKIKQMIVSNRLAPGTLLSIDDFVQWLTISRTPVREALLRLQSEHLVEILPQRAIRVTDITQAEVRDVFVVRELLECAAVEHASQTIPVDLLSELDAQMVSAESQLKAEKSGPFVETDLILHNLINRYSGNTLVTELLTLILDRAKRIQVFSGTESGEENAKAVTAEHRAIIDALRRREGDAARRLLAQHLRNAAQRILNQVRSHDAAGHRTSPE